MGVDKAYIKTHTQKDRYMFPIVIFIGKDFEHFFFLSRLFFIVVTFDYA